MVKFLKPKGVRYSTLLEGILTTLQHLTGAPNFSVRKKFPSKNNRIFEEMAAGQKFETARVPLSKQGLSPITPYKANGTSGTQHCSHKRNTKFPFALL
jgi:hypothetical protein